MDSHLVVGVRKFVIQKPTVVRMAIDQRFMVVLEKFSAIREWVY